MLVKKNKMYYIRTTFLTHFGGSMALRLPRWESLSQDEQIPIINLALTRTYVVTGGPGTGKTVMAIHRAAKWKAEQDAETNGKIKFLVFNKPLMRYLKQALIEANLPEASAQNWHPWFYKFYRDRIGTNVPEISKYNPNWELVTPQLLPVLQAAGPLFDHLILDESQDLPKELLCLLKHACRHATVFADERQSLSRTGSSIADITNAFDAGAARYFLNRNYRNTQEVADLAQLFYTGDTTDLPARPLKRGDKPKLIKVASFENAVKLITTYGDNNPEQNIGVLLPDFNLRQKYFDEIKKSVETVSVQQYDTRDDNNFDFDADGIKLLTFNTMKGLEFDAVFMPEIDNAFFQIDSREHLNNAYVSMTRAKDKLYLIYSDSASQSFIIKKINDSPTLALTEEY
jgi:DNA helicase IV